MKTSFNYVLALIALTCDVAAALISYQIPGSTPSNATGNLDAAPVGVSFEFFTWPNYYSAVDATLQCLANLQEATGVQPRIRIGGTTQDRGTFDPSTTVAITYPSATATAVPASMIYGPQFFRDAAAYGGLVTLGLNRRLNNISNSIAAAKSAVSYMPNLDSIELGNEPDFYSSSDPIANGMTWNPAADATSQISWIGQVGAALGKFNIMKGGVFFARSASGYSVQEFAPKLEASGNNTYNQVFAGHSYPQSACGGATTSLQTLMSHSSIVSYTASFKAEVSAAQSAGKQYHIGETNSATCGGGGISPQFGSALWIVDYTLQAVLMGVKRLYYHQGTIGNCPYCWWGRYSVGNPYWGGYMASLALAGIDSIAQLDAGNTAYGTYALYASGQATKLVLYNSDYYTSGSRSNQTWSLSGLTGASLKVLRLTSSSATAVGSTGAANRPNISGLGFTDGTCVKSGTQVAETATINCGTATVVVAASELVLVYLDNTGTATCE